MRKNTRWILVSLAIVLAMSGLTAASVPLYRIFCNVTGYGGAVKRVSSAPTTISDRIITIRFNADVNKDLPWAFSPKQKEMKVRLGQQEMAYYKAKNLSSESTAGMATYNVTPEKAAVYFNKIQCFCFTKQELAAGQETDFPVLFFVDPEIANDALAKDVDTITLSYTFFPYKNKGGVNDGKK